MEEKNADAAVMREDAELGLEEEEQKADVGEEELDEEQQEKEPMTGAGERSAEAPCAAAGAEKNGSVKLKMEEEQEEVKFTGLSKEELLRVAGTPGWVRTRWTLLVLFWVAWLLMLIGSVLLILNAPPCRELPDSHWWNHGALYRIKDIRVFSDTQDLRGVEQHLDYLSQLKVKGLVIGPIHEAPPNDALGLRFEQISSELGTNNQFKSLVSNAHKKGISVVLDLTPNYQGSSGLWFSNTSITIVAEKLKSALVFWMDEGVDGFQLSGTDFVSSVVPSLWTDIRNIIQNGTDHRPGRRVLLGRSEFTSVENVSSLGLDLLVYPLLSPGSMGSAEVLVSVEALCSYHSPLRLAWTLGAAEKHLASVAGPALVRLYQLLLLTLPGTPVFNYGDELGLLDEGEKLPRMLWEPETELNGTLQEEWAERRSSLSFFHSVSILRVKERPLMFGDFLLLSNSSLLSYFRVWDHGTRYFAAFNLGSKEAGLDRAVGATLSMQAEVVVSTNDDMLPTGSELELNRLRLSPQQAVLLRLNN